MIRMLVVATLIHLSGRGLAGVAAAPAGRMTRAVGPPRASSSRRRGSPPPLTSPRRATSAFHAAELAAVTVAALATAVLVGGLPGLTAGGGAALVIRRVVRRLERRDAVAERREIGHALPLALDLMCACTAAGAGARTMLPDVARAVGGPLGARLARVARSWSLGAETEQAWRMLDADGVPGTAQLVLAVGRAERAGAPLVASLEALSAQLRREALAAGETAARRAAVIAVAPLGLCFLPAFVLLTIVPLVAGLLVGAPVR